MQLYGILGQPSYMYICLSDSHIFENYIPFIKLTIGGGPIPGGGIGGPIPGGGPPGGPIPGGPPGGPCIPGGGGPPGGP